MAKRVKQGKQKRGRGTDSLRGQKIALDIHDMAHGGSGMGRYRGRSVFVPYTLPGESIIAEISGGSGNALFGRGLQLKAASADRVTPQCPHFGPDACWGCQWQHIDYAAQLLLKQDVLADQLGRLGKLPDKLIESVLRPVLPAPEQWQYKHSLRLLRDETGGWGLKRAERGGIELIDECPVTHPDLLDLLAELDLEYEAARRMTLRRGSDGRLMLIFELDVEEEPELSTDLPLSVNLMLPDREPVNLIGDAHSYYEINGRRFRATAGAYMRDNLGGLELLVGEAEKALELVGGERALDLYAGVGIFSALMAEAADLVTLVESYPPAVSDTDVNLGSFDNIDVVEGQVESVLADMVAEGARYDVALLDPPNRGIHEAVAGSLSQLGLRRIVYLSDDPASLARDSKRLMGVGFRLREIEPIDLAPQTYYISAIARFER